MDGVMKEGHIYCFLATNDNGDYRVGCACKIGYMGPTKTVDEIVKEQKEDPTLPYIQCSRS